MMHKRIFCFIPVLIFFFLVLSAHARPVRVIMLDFADETGGNADIALTGSLDSKTFTEKGPYFLQKSLLSSSEFTLIDRRDFIRQIEELRLRDGSDPVPNSFFASKERHTPLSPTFFNAARSLNGDALIRGSLLALSTSKQKINQGGYQADFTTLNLRVVLQALDTVDGDVIAIEEGRASRKFRQTSSVQTEIGEDELLDLYQQAIAAAVPGIKMQLQGRINKDTKVKIWITTSADPALIELDGILLGSSPVEGVEVIRGDHTLTVTRPGYETITKKIMLESNMKITVPMISNQLNAKERKEALSNMNLRILKIN
jgi:PEGA domain-containing protein